MPNVCDDFMLLVQRLLQRVFTDDAMKQITSVRKFMDENVKDVKNDRYLSKMSPGFVVRVECQSFGLEIKFRTRIYCQRALLAHSKQRNARF